MTLIRAAVWVLAAFLTFGSSTVLAAPDGSISWANGSPGVNNTDSSISASGTYTSNNGWTATSATLVAVDANGGVIHTAVQNPLNGGQWSATIPNVPNGTYTVYVLLTVTAVGQDPQIFTATVTQGGVRVAAAKTKVGPKPLATITWSPGQPVAGGGSGTSSLVPGAQGASTTPKPIRLTILPTGGGLVYFGDTAPTQNPQLGNPWSVGVNGVPNGNYVYIGAYAVERAPVPPAVTPTDAQIVSTSPVKLP